MSQTHPNQTLELLDEIEPEFKPGTWVTGPVGISDRMAKQRIADGKGVHLRMILEDGSTSTESSQVRLLHRSDLGALEDLHRSDPDAAFFLPTMLERGMFVGIWEGRQLTTSAGTHVMSERYSVAALGAIITRPSHRGKGLASDATSALCALLRPRIRTIGLNVAASNSAAIGLYERLGFRSHLEYEEVELL